MAERYYNFCVAGGMGLTMDAHKRINKVFGSSKQIRFDDTAKFVMISDCHRGDASWSDNFAKNQNIYFYALTDYYKQGYTYIELGDGDELWENKTLAEIKQQHSNAFWLLEKFYHSGRLHMLYGNHDVVKKDKKYVQANLYDFYNEREKKTVPLFKDMEICEGLILHYTVTGNNIFLMHGHQGDLLNDTFWKLARFLVRYLWRPLEVFGVNDPTSAARNFYKKGKVTDRLSDWSKKQHKMLIAGHTHKPVFPYPGETLYFNDGSCVHPRCITAIEIVNGAIMLVKWSVQTKEDASLYVDKEILAGPVKLKDYFKDIQNEQYGLSAANSTR